MSYAASNDSDQPMDLSVKRSTVTEGPNMAETAGVTATEAVCPMATDDPDEMHWDFPDDIQHPSVREQENPEFPESIKKQRKIHTYSQSNLLKAIDMIKRGLLCTKRASKDFCVPRSTIQYRMSEKLKKKKGTRGRLTVLTPDEERSIVEWLIEMQQRGFPVTPDSLRHTVAKFLIASPRPNPFRENVPGKGWLKCFLQRHKDLAFRTPEAVSKASACVSEPDIRRWFERVKDHCLKNGLDEIFNDPTRQINADETGFSLNPSPTRVLAEKGAKNVPIIEANNAKQNITVLYCFSADGYAFPPQVILPYKRLKREIVQSFPQEWDLGTTSSGWMDSKNFMLYIRRILYPSLVKRNVKLPVLFYVDGHKSHMAFEAAQACAELGIVLIALHPNSTRILQPADVGIFKPLKLSWATSFENYKATIGNDCVTITSFGTVLKQAMAAAFKKETIRNSFRACGLFPFNPDAVDFSKCLGKASSETEAMLTDNRNGIVCDDLEIVEDAGESCYAENYTYNAFTTTACSDGTTNPPELNHLDSEFGQQAMEYVYPSHNSIPLKDITNNQTPNILSFLITPEAPKRSSKHINYKYRSYDILTVEERLNELSRIEEEKESDAKRKIALAEKRANDKVQKQTEKEERKQEREKKKAERLRILEEKRKEIETRKAKKRDKQMETTTPKMARKGKEN